MSILSRQDYLDSLGQPGVHVLPSNQSTLLADSRTRDDPNASVFNFKINCDRIRMKEFYYNTLYWKQSLYTHNASNCELVYRFQYPNSDPSPLYVCYAMPFVTYTSFDGNPDGSVYAVPNPNVVSYARQMEYALNQDYRLYDSNTVSKNVNYTGDGWGLAGGINVRFRYNSSGGGFAIWADNVDEEETDQPSIQILQCSWISGGYNIHGFGFPYPQYQPVNASDNPVNTQTPVYGPNPNFLRIYYAESYATLLPFRYIVITSPELTKDRRIPSFHSGNVSRFNNEIAIFPLVLSNCNIWHAERTNDDSTVVSIRENYAPESASFLISDEVGNILTTSMFFANVMNDNSLPEADKINMLSNATSYGGNRFSPALLNAALFNAAASITSFHIPPNATKTNTYGNGSSNALPDDVSHELTVIIKDN
jgi:hypothetical protein